MTTLSEMQDDERNRRNRLREAAQGNIYFFQSVVGLCNQLDQADKLLIEQSACIDRLQSEKHFYELRETRRLGRQSGDGLPEIPLEVENNGPEIIMLDLMKQYGYYPG